MMLCYEVCIVHMSTTFTLPKYREKCIITRKKKNNKTNLIYIHTIGRLKIVIQNSQYKPIPDKIPREKNVIWHMRMSPKTPLNLYIRCVEWKVIICNMHTRRYFMYNATSMYCQTFSEEMHSIFATVLVLHIPILCTPESPYLCTLL